MHDYHLDHKMCEQMESRKSLTSTLDHKEIIKNGNEKKGRCG